MWSGPKRVRESEKVMKTQGLLQSIILVSSWVKASPVDPDYSVLLPPHHHFLSRRFSSALFQSNIPPLFSKKYLQLLQIIMTDANHICEPP